MCPCLGIHALLVVAVILSPVTAAAWSENDVTQEDAYPPLWDLATENLLDFPVKDNKIVINAWNYQERLGLYKSLLKASAKYFSAFGPQNSGNILWGLPLQHGWQFRTERREDEEDGWYSRRIDPMCGRGKDDRMQQLRLSGDLLQNRSYGVWPHPQSRLADPSGVTSCGYENGELLCQSVRSWWSCMNYYLAIIPFLGAVEAGLFGQLPYEIEILPPEQQKEDFCYSVKDCWSRMPELMDDWKAFFEYLLSTEHIAVSSASFSSFKLDDALGLMWKAHTTSIAYALPKFQDSLKYLFDPEANFGEDWANGVDFIAATHFSTDLLTTNSFQAFLPQRMLVEGDVPPSIRDFSPEQNIVLVSLRALHKADRLTGGLLLKLWQKAMSTEEGRKMGRKLIESLASSQEEFGIIWKEMI